MYRVSRFVRNFARALLGGAVVATVWVNISPNTYYDAVEFRLTDLSLPAWTKVSDVTVTPIAVVSDALMALFLFFIGKELWEAMVLERGALAGRLRLTMPIGAVLGGMVGAVAAWLIWSSLFVTTEDASFLTGWTVPLGSDVVLCYVVGRAVFGSDHPALHLLLLITIGFDILGLLFSGLVSPLSEIRPLWFLLPILSLLAVWAGFSRLAGPESSELQHRRAYVLWPYLLAGALVWVGVALSGLPPALGLLPLIPMIPHAERSFGLFAEAEAFLTDPLNRIARLMLGPMPWILFLFGLTRGGVDFRGLVTDHRRGSGGAVVRQAAWPHLWCPSGGGGGRASLAAGPAAVGPHAHRADLGDRVHRADPVDRHSRSGGRTCRSGPAWPCPQPPCRARCPDPWPGDPASQDPCCQRCAIVPPKTPAIVSRSASN